MPVATFPWELLARSAARIGSQRFERGATLIGLLVPLLICGWTIARPFDLRQSYHNLLQCAIWLAAWSALFAVCFAVLVWLRPRVQREGEELAHLPLPATYFFLLRVLELCLVPLRCALLTLPLWLIVLAYIQVPYGNLNGGHYFWLTGYGDSMPWWWRIVWLTLAIIGATTLPLGIALLISETIRLMPVRIALLMLPAGGLYALQRLLPDHFREPYRTTQAYYLPAFLIMPICIAVFLFTAGLIPRHTRVLLATLLLAIAITVYALPRFGGATGHDAKLIAGVTLRSIHYSDVWLVGHLSPPRNVRLMLERSDSNVLMKQHDLPPEQAYPDSPASNAPEAQKEWERRTKAWEQQARARDEQYAKLPRIPMWVGAGLLPVLWPLLILTGLLLGARRKGVERADART